MVEEKIRRSKIGKFLNLAAAALLAGVVSLNACTDSRHPSRQASFIMRPCSKKSWRRSVKEIEGVA